LDHPVYVCACVRVSDADRGSGHVEKVGYGSDPMLGNEDGLRFTGSTHDAARRQVRPAAVAASRHVRHRVAAVHRRQRQRHELNVAQCKQLGNHT